MNTDSARQAILASVRGALGQQADSGVGAIPTSARLGSRTADEPDREIDLLLDEISKLGGITRRLPSARAVPAALRELVEAEKIRKAMVWNTPELQAAKVAENLRALGVEIVPSHAAPQQLAECELGVTEVDAALPETGTLVLRAGPDKPRLVSLLPRVHVALVRASALRADLSQAFADIKNDSYGVCITGPSRTADIELTVTIGVHGPKSLYVWVIDQ
jgi:L-lactate dehydrogenase complex protein LldG